MTRLTLALSATALMATSACAAKNRPPAIVYDPARFQPASVQADPPSPVKIVTLPQPLPLPGQLEPVSSVKADVRPPTARVDAANRSATREPTAAGYVNAVQVYPWSDGALYRLYTAPEKVSDIALQPGEQLVAVSAGDTVRWVIGDTVSGTGDTRQAHVLVKPFAPGLHTNMVITTARRTYHIALDSTDATAMAAVSWTYPQDQLMVLQRENAQAQAAKPVATGIDLDNLHFRYVISGDDAPWRPVRAWDDGAKVYIEFPSRLDQGEAPPLFVVGPTGDSQLVNYRVSGHYYVVDRLFAAAELRLGDKPQQVVRISRTDGEVADRRRP